MTSKSARLRVHMTPEQKRLVEQAAEVAGQTMASFVRAAALERAQATIAQAPRTVLSPRDWEAFQRLLAEPPEPTPALRRALAAALRDRA